MITVIRGSVLVASQVSLLFFTFFLLVASLHVPIRLSERGFEGCLRRRSQLVDSGFSSGARRIIYRVLRCDGGVGRTDRGRKMDLSELGTDGPTEALGVGVCVCVRARSYDPEPADRLP